MRDIAEHLERLGLNQLLLTVAIAATITFMTGCQKQEDLRDLFKKVGGSEVIRNACEELHKQLLKDEYVTDIPKDNQLNVLKPQFVNLITKNGVTYYNIQMSGGFRHSGYLVRAQTRHQTNSLPFPYWTKTSIGEGVFIYHERRP